MRSWGLSKVRVFPHTPTLAGFSQSIMCSLRPLHGRRAQPKLDERPGFLTLGVAFAQTSLPCGSVDAGTHIRRGLHKTELSSIGLSGPHICDGSFGGSLAPFLEADILDFAADRRRTQATYQKRSGRGD